MRTQPGSKAHIKAEVQQTFGVDCVFIEIPRKGEVVVVYETPRPWETQIPDGGFEELFKGCVPAGIHAEAVSAEALFATAGQLHKAVRIVKFLKAVCWLLTFIAVVGWAL